MERRAAGALLALAACVLGAAAAPTASNHTALDLYDGAPEGCYYNFQHYGEGDRIMTNEPCLNCTCHNRMLMCYLRVCPFTKPIGQDCTVEKRADQCCPIVTCPDVPVDLLTLTSTTSPAEYGATGIGKLDKYGCSINGKYFPEGSKVPPTPNKPCEHCYCIRNMTTCVMQECTLHVDGCTPIYHKDVCCPVRYSCDHAEDEILLLDDKTTTVRPTPGFLLTTTTNSPVTQFTQDCVHDDQIFSDGALIKTEKACEHCYCMKGDIVCVVQECGTPMENEGKNCTSLPPREGQCCPDTYICEGDELNTEYPSDKTTEYLTEELTTLSPPRRVGVEGSGYRKEPDNIVYGEPHPTETAHEGSGDSHESEPSEGDKEHISDVYTTEDYTKYSTVPSVETEDKEDSEQDVSVKPSAESTVATDTKVSEDNQKATTIPAKDQEITHEETVDHDKTESSTSNIPSLDHQLDISQPDVQSATEREVDEHGDTITLTTIAPMLEEKEVTTVKSLEESIVTDAETADHDKYTTKTTTAAPILEDEGITTESDREQQTIPAGPGEEQNYEPGAHMASTTSAPFLEEVEEIPTSSYEQNVVTDGITESDIYDPTQVKTESITTPAVEESDNQIDVHKHPDVDYSKPPEIDSHELGHTATNVPTIEEVERSSTTFPEDLITNKPSAETYETDKLTPTSTHQPVSIENEEGITEDLKETPVSTQTPESLDSHKLADEIGTSQTEKYDQVTENKMYDDIAATTSVPVIDDQKEDDTKVSKEPTTVTSETVEGEITDYDKDVILTTSAPSYDDNLPLDETKASDRPQEQDITIATSAPTYEHLPTDDSKDTDKPQTQDSKEHADKDIATTTSAPYDDILPTDEKKDTDKPEVHDNKEDADKYITTATSAPTYDDHLPTDDGKHTHEPQVQDNKESTKPSYIEEGEKATTIQEISYESSTEKIFEQETYESYKPTSTSAPITEEVEMATTEFTKDQDFVTTAILEQDSLKPSDHGPSTSSTPFLEEIEKLTTEVSHGHVVTDAITEKEDLEPSKQVIPVTESSLPSETADITTAEPDKGLNTIPSGTDETEKSSEHPAYEKSTQESDLTDKVTPYPPKETSDKEVHADLTTTVASSLLDDSIVKEDKVIVTTEPSSRKEDKHHVEDGSSKTPETITEILDEISQTTQSFEQEETKSPSETPSDELHDIHENIPTSELSTVASGTDANIPETEIKPHIEESLTTQPTLPEITTINLGENEIDEDNVLSPGRIPGEGDCLLNGVTYRNESVVPSTNKCHSDCRCVSSIIKCSPIICSSPPEYVDNCQPIYDSPDSCCPTYVCDQLRETLPPMPHIQITTEIPQKTTSIECRGDQCELEVDKTHPTVDSESETDKTQTDISSCGPHGCTESSSTSEACVDGKCTPTTEECSNGECKHPSAAAPQCEGKNCDSAPVNLPQTPEQAPETIPVPLPCTEESGCKETEVNVVQDCADESCRRKDTSNIQAKPSSCVGPDCGQQTPIQVAIETSTLGESTGTQEIDAATTEFAVHQTVVSEHDFTTEINKDDMTSNIETTQQTVQAEPELETHKKPTSSQEEPQLPESMDKPKDKESDTETYTKPPKLESDNDILSTKIPEEYVTEMQQIDIEEQKTPTDKEPAYETSKPGDKEHTESSTYLPDAVDHTIRVITGEEIPTKEQSTIEYDETLGTTSEPKLSESEKPATQQPEQSITKLVEEQVTESQDRATLPDIAAAEHEEYTKIPLYTETKSDVSTHPDIVPEITTEYQYVPEHASEPKITTLPSTELYITEKEYDDKVTESNVQQGDEESNTPSYIFTTELKPVSFESSTQENIDVNLPDATVASKEPALPAESSEGTTEHDLKEIGKEPFVTEENLIPSVTDKIQELDEDHIAGTVLPDMTISESTDSTSELSIKDHEVNTEQELHTGLPEKESEVEEHKEADLDLTSPSVVYSDETTKGIIKETEMIESSTSAPQKIEEETIAVTSDRDASTETSEALPTTESSRITEKPHEIEQESTQTEKSHTPSYDGEPETGIMEHVTMPEKATTLPEILSHKKEHSSESPIVSESETEKSIAAEDGVTKQPEPSTHETSSPVSVESEVETEKPETLTEESQPPIMKDETSSAETAEEKPEKPVVIPEEISTEDIHHLSDFEKSTEHGEITQPDQHETEVSIPVKAEQSTIHTPIQEEIPSTIPEITPVTDKHEEDISGDKVETITDKEVQDLTSPQPYATEAQEPESGYTEKAETITSDSTTKTVETLTTEQPQVVLDTSTLTASEFDKAVTEKETTTKEVEITEILDMTKDREITTESSEHYNTAEDLGTKIQDDVTPQQEYITDIPDIHASTLSDQSSKSPVLTPETLVTESQDISKVPDEEQITEVQAPVTDREHPLITDLPEEEPPKDIQPATDVPKTPIEISTPESETTASHEQQGSPVETITTTERDEISLSSAAPHVTEIETIDATETPNKVTIVPESTSIKSEEAMPSLPQDDESPFEGQQTISPVPFTEEPSESSSQISDSEKVEHADTATETPEPIDSADADIITPVSEYESPTVPQETATETLVGGISTEPAQHALDVHDKDEITKPSPIPEYEAPETTPYLIELQEHTHKTIPDVTTSSPIEEATSTVQAVSEGIEHEHTVPESITEGVIDKQTEGEEPIKHLEEITTPVEIFEKSTQPTIYKDEESLSTTQSAAIEVKQTTLYEEVTTSSPTKATEIEKESTPESAITETEDKLVTSERPIQNDLASEVTTAEEVSVPSTEKATTAKAEQIQTEAPLALDTTTKLEEKPSELPAPFPDLSKPSQSDIQPTDEIPSPDEETHFPPSGSSGYGGEPDYVEEDQAFGPGTCRYGGKVYVSAQQIPRDDPCDFCFCFRSDIICLQQSCPPPIHGCHEEPIQGFCCPRYECPVSMATTLNVTTTTTTTTTTLPPHFPTHSYKGAAQRRGCQIKGHTYKVGEVVRGSSGPCLHCTCGGDGQMKCDPKACTPEPMLRQMIAAAVSAKRRR